MKVRMLTTAACPDYILHAGSNYDLPEELAARFIAARAAVPINKAAKCAAPQTVPKDQRGPRAPLHPLEPAISVEEAGGKTGVAAVEAAAAGRQAEMALAELAKTATPGLDLMPR